MAVKTVRYPRVSSNKKAWNWVKTELTIMYTILRQFRTMANDLRINKDKYVPNDYVEEYCEAMNSTIGNFMHHVVYNFDECHELYESFKVRRLYYESRARKLKLNYYNECSRVNHKSSRASQKPSEP